MRPGLSVRAFCFEGRIALNRRTRTLLAVLLALALTGSLVRFLGRAAELRTAKESYAQAEAMAGPADMEAPLAEDPESPAEEPPAPVDEHAARLLELDIEALQAVNGDVLGWLEIPGSAVSYPLVQGTDNQYYLEHTWNREPSAAGAIFLETRCDGDLSGFNTVVYGHRMMDGSMFGSLKYYKEQSYWAEHPFIYIADGQACRRYEIFAAYEVPVTGTAYQIGFPGEADRQAFLDDCTARSVIETGVCPTACDQILTLSTCTGKGHAARWVVQARLPGET